MDYYGGTDQLLRRHRSTTTVLPVDHSVVTNQPPRHYQSKPTALPISHGVTIVPKWSSERPLCNQVLHQLVEKLPFLGIASSPVRCTSNTLRCCPKRITASNIRNPNRAKMTPSYLRVRYAGHASPKDGNTAPTSKHVTTINSEHLRS